MVGLSSRAAALQPRAWEEDSSLVPPLPPTLTIESRWQRLIAGAWREPAAIHTKEQYIAVRGLLAVARHRAFHHTTVVSLGDNMSELLACEKGRATSFDLNAGCRRACAVQVSTGNLLGGEGTLSPSRIPLMATHASSSAA